MNLLERLEHIAQSIADLFRKVPADIKQFSANALVITTAAKNALDGDLAKAVVAAIPGEWDNTLRAAAVALLGNLIGLLQKAVNDAPDEWKKRERNTQLAKMHSELIALQDGNELSENRYDLYAALCYSAKK